MDFSQQPDKQEPIAIVGAACRFAGEASSLGSLWDMITKVKTGHGPVPSDRWDGNMWHHPDSDRKGGIGPQHGYFLDQDISHFDAPFFSVTAKEAASMDPMKRMLLEVCYESIENAGILVENLMNSRTGCYVGCMTNDYEMISLHDIYDIGHPAATGLSEAMTANRVSWFFGLKGPSLTLDTACSSSLYALHLACQSLRLRETNMSLVTGVNLMINPNTSHQLTAMHMLSHEGISHTFDDRANGYGRGDGIGSMVVKRLSDAIRDGDTIRAVIRGSGVNADGKTPSVTQPSSTAQADLIMQTYEDAGLDLADTGYFECHGTGTPVGDPLELTAIAQTLGAARSAAGKPALPIGSIKPTVGHTEGCAGLAGVFKSIMMLEKGMLAPTYGVERVNPKLKLNDWHLTLPDHVMPWPTLGLRRISVNSFGFGGANAHVILDDAYHYLQARGMSGRHNVDIRHPSSDSGDSGLPGTPQNELNIEMGHELSPKKLFLLSGKDQAGAKRVAETLTQWLQGDSLDKHDVSMLDNLAYTLAMRRSHLEHRNFAVAGSLSELTDKLSRGLPVPVRSQRHGDNVVMVFTGQGAQWPTMGRELLNNAIFRRSMEDSQSYLESFGCEWNVMEELSLPSNPKVNLPQYSQPLCTVVQVALVDLLRSWNITPTATIGHSSGEIGAAYAASLLTHQDATKLAYVRGISSAAVTKKGAMMAAGLSQKEAQAYLDKIAPGSAVVACVNSPSSVTLSGDVEAIDRLETIISGDGKFARKLKVTTAYHSPHMREVSPTYLEMIGDMTPRPAVDGNQTVMYSSLTGLKVASSSQLDAQYWVDNMQNPVQFSQALTALLKHRQVSPGVNRPVAVQWGAMVEVGPHAALQGPVRQIIDAANNKFAKAAPYASMLLRNRTATETAMGAAGILWAAGAKVNLSAVNDHVMANPATAAIVSSRHSPNMLCDLPPYPWNHGRSYWHESYASRSYRFPSEPRSDYLGVAEDGGYEPRWRNYLRVTENPWIEDHVITGTVLYPGAGMLVMALEGALRTADASKGQIEGFKMTNVSFERGMVISLDDEAPLETRISLHPHHSKMDAWIFTVYSMSKGSPWAKHCTGTIAIVYEKAPSEIEESDQVDAAWQRRVSERSALLEAERDATIAVDVDAFYKDLDSIGMQYGPTFRNVKTLTAVPALDSSYGTVAVPDTKTTMPANYESPHIIHPATLDSIFHLVIASLAAGRPKQSAVPYAIEELYIARNQPQESGALYSGYGRLLSQSGHEMMTELFVSDEKWKTPKLTIKNFALRQVTSGDGLDTSDMDASETASTNNCAGLTWIPDVSLFTSPSWLSKLVATSQDDSPLGKLFDSVFLNKPENTVLVVMCDEAPRNVGILASLKNRAYRPTKIIAMASSDSGLDMMKTTLGQDIDKTAIVYQRVAESDIPSLHVTSLDMVIGLGIPKISENGMFMSKLSPLTCLTRSVAEEGKGHNELPTDLEATKWCISGSFLLSSSHISTVAPTSPERLAPRVILLVPTEPSLSVKSFTSALQKTLSTTLNLSTATATLENIVSSFTSSEMSRTPIISLLELESPLIYSFSEPVFAAFKALISSSPKILWLTRGSLLESWAGGVEYAATQGLFRVLRNEYPLATLPTLDLSSQCRTREGVDVVVEVLLRRTSLLLDSAEGEELDGEMEFAERDSIIYVPRATEEAAFDREVKMLREEGGESEVVQGTLEKGEARTRRRFVRQGKSTGVWVLDDDESGQADIPVGQVEIQVEFIGRGERHAAGLVTRVGEGVGIPVGSQVVVYHDNAARTHIRQTESLVALLPKGLHPHEAVALVEPLMTARHALMDRANLNEGQTLLIDDAGSALGQSLVQVANGLKAHVFALVKTKADKDILVEKYGVPADHIFDSGRNNFVARIQDVTDNRGLNLLIIQQPGTHVVEALSILDDFGHLVDLSGKDKMEISLPSSKANATLTRISMASTLQGRPSLIGQLFRSAFTTATYPLRGPSPLHVLPVTDLASTDSSASPPTVLSLHDASPILIPAPAPTPLALDSSATYVLAGGLGALGLEIAAWMIDHGARSITFLSRSGKTAKTAPSLEALSTRGGPDAHISALACDVTSAYSVASAFSTIERTTPNFCHVGGVIQLAMVLSDGIFDNMDFSSWQRAFLPKTLGSRNLLSNMWPGGQSSCSSNHDNKPFYILLSSITGVIGNTAQANYAAGNTFEDGLARHAREHLGVNATSVDVGLVSDSAHFKEDGTGGQGFGGLEGYLGKFQHGWQGLQTSNAELGIVLRAIMRDSAAAPAQLVVGLGDRVPMAESGFSRDGKFALRVVQPRGERGGGAGAKAEETDVGTLLQRAGTMSDAAAVVEGNIRELVAKSMGVAMAEVDGGKPLFDYGVDSLQAVEIRNRAIKNMRSEISVFDILSAMPLTDVAAKIAKKSQLVKVAGEED